MAAKRLINTVHTTILKSSYEYIANAVQPIFLKINIHKIQLLYLSAAISLHDSKMCKLGHNLQHVACLVTVTNCVESPNQQLQYSRNNWYGTC